MWSKYCFICDLIKVFENEMYLDDDEMGDEDDSGDGISGEDDEDRMCYVILNDYYYYFKEVEYGVLVRFVKQGFLL